MTDFRIVTLVCSPRKRPAVHTGRAGGNQWWSRDTFHVADATGKKTVCGRKCEDWITIERRSVSATRTDLHLCSRCAVKISE